MYPSRRQRTALARDLKRFAFEQSPMFERGKIQAMETTQTYELIEVVPEAQYMPGTLMYDQVRIKLGFSATRFSDSERSHPVYSYQVSTEGTQLIHPRQLELTDDAWIALWKKYLDEAPLPEEDTEDTFVRAETVPTDMKDEIIDCLIDDGAECELYQKSMLSYASCEDGIESSYERGVSIGNGLFDSVSTHDHYESDWEAFETPDGILYVPPCFAPDELSIGDEIEVRNQFVDIIRAFGTDKQAAENGLLPHEDKLREMMHIVECMRKRQIDL